MIPLDAAVMQKLRTDIERKHIDLAMKQPALVVSPPTTAPLQGYRKEPLRAPVRNRNEQLQLHIDADTPAFMRAAIEDAFFDNRQFDWV